MAAIEAQIELKILVDQEKKKVLFAEADGDIVDVLFSWLTLPLGTIVRVMVKKTHSEPQSAGCFTNLYQSLKNLNNEHFCADVFKDMVVNPRSCSDTLCRNLKINIDDTRLLMCSCKGQFGRTIPLSIYSDLRCSNCGLTCLEIVNPLEFSKNCSKVFVNETSKFIISECFQVSPVFPGMVMFLLQNHGVNDMNVLEETIVKLGFIELLELLKLTFLSTSPLTDLFVSKQIPVLQKPSLQPKQPISEPQEEKKIDIKVMLKKSTKQLLYVGAHQDFVDFLLSFLIMPLGQLLHIMDGQSDSGSLDRLYKSALSLDSKYFISQDHKNGLLRPMLPPHFNRVNRFFALESAPIKYKKGTMDANTEMRIVDDSKGFMREESVFFVLDNLEVIPFSIASVLSIFKRNNALISDLEEKALSIGVADGLRILRAALTSSSAISNGLLHSDLIYKEPKQEK